MRLSTQSKAFAVSTRTTQMEEGFVKIEQRNKSSEKTATHIFLITLFLTDMLAHFCIILPAEVFWIFWAFFLIFLNNFCNGNKQENNNRWLYTAVLLSISSHLLVQDRCSELNGSVEVEIQRGHQQCPLIVFQPPSQHTHANKPRQLLSARTTRDSFVWECVRVCISISVWAMCVVHYYIQGKQLYLILAWCCNMQNLSRMGLVLTAKALKVCMSVYVHKESTVCVAEKQQYINLLILIGSFTKGNWIVLKTVRKSSCWNKFTTHGKKKVRLNNCFFFVLIN